MGWNDVQKADLDWDRMGKEETRCANLRRVLLRVRHMDK